MDKLNSSINNELFKLIEELFPICRSITGNGTRETLRRIQSIIPLQIKEIPSGTKVFDWHVPLEWNINDAFIKDSKGEKIVDFHKSNLSVVNYSIPVNKKVGLSELKKHLHTIPEKPDWIPYKTSYYKDDWGFCLPHNQFEELSDGEYQVYIDSSLSKGVLNYGEILIKGDLNDEVLFSTHICHPSMCNDNLSGLAVNTFLAKYISAFKNRKYSYRFIFIPATIGAISWLFINQKKLNHIKYGYVTALLGDNGDFHYKKSRFGNSNSDKIAEFILSNYYESFELLNFSPYGYDERQFCSPGINLPIGRITRTPNGQFPEYHTSADNLDFISEEKLFESYQLLTRIIDTIEQNDAFLNQNPHCEPQLGKRGIYNSVAGNIKEIELALLWVLNYSDGEHDLVDISMKSKIEFDIIRKAANILQKHELIKPLLEKKI